MRVGASCFCSLFIAQIEPTMAEQVNWALTLGAPHKLSTGAALPASTRFQLGTFVQGFIPTVANKGEWLSKWRSRAEIPNDQEFSGFDTVMYVEETPAPFLPGVQLYVWGWAPISASTSEWMLFTDPTWQMPAAVDPFSFPIFWDLTAATQKIIGSVDEATGSIVMASVDAIQVPAFHYVDWLSQWFFLVQRENASIVAPLADNDHDRVPNLLEYFAGTSPLESSLSPLTIVRDPVTNKTSVRFSKSWSARTEWSLQESDELENWAITADPIILDLPNNSIRADFTEMKSSHFWRISVGNPSTP